MNKLQKRIEKISFTRILIFALLIRLVLVPLISFPSDLDHHVIWGLYADEFGLRGYYDWLNFGNYARPEYPPLAILLFMFIRKLWSLLFAVFWKLNVSIPLFPSNFILWFETKGYLSLLKLPGILADIGIGVLIYNFIAKKSKKHGKFISSLFLFNPAIIYLSSLWGQIESIVSYFGLMAVIYFVNKAYEKGILSFLASIFVKATFVPASLILGIKIWMDKVKAKKLIRPTIILLLLFWLIGFFFTDHNYIFWTINTYKNKFLSGPVTLPYINLNAFNFWGLILGLERILASSEFLGVQLSLWAYLIAGLFILFIVFKYINNKNIFFTILILYFTIFMFFPRVHERYLYMVFVFFPLVVYQFKKMLPLFLVASVVFLLNLYHWWWFPRIPILINILDLEFIERGLSALNLLIFISILKKYNSLPARK